MSAAPAAESADRLEFRYDLVYEDLRAVRRYASNHSPEGKPKPRTSKAVWIWLAFFVGMIVFFMATGRAKLVEPEPRGGAGAQTEAIGDDGAKTAAPQHPGLRQYYGLIVLASLIAALYIFVKFSIGRQLRRLAEGPDYKNQVCTISAEGIVMAATDVYTVYRWTKFPHLVLTKQHLMLPFSQGQVHVVPRRAIGDADNVSRALTCIGEWYSGPIINEEGMPLTIAARRG